MFSNKSKIESLKDQSKKALGIFDSTKKELLEINKIVSQEMKFRLEEVKRLEKEYEELNEQYESGERVCNLGVRDLKKNIYLPVFKYKFQPNLYNYK